VGYPLDETAIVSRSIELLSLPLDAR